MDAVMSKMIGKALEGYFQIFFVNFNKDDFRLNMGAAETMSTLHNLEINRQVVQEIFGNPNLEVQDVSIKTLTVKIRPTKINKVPIVIHIDHVNCILKEPHTNLKPLPTVLEEFFKRFVQKDGKSSYGFVEKIIDGITIEIDEIHAEVVTRGTYKTAEAGPWTPPRLVVDIRDVSCVTTNERWEAVDLRQARDYNKDKPEICVFKALSVGSFNVELHAWNGERIVPLVTNLHVRLNVVLKKRLDNQITGVSIHVRIDGLQLLVKMQDVTLLHAILTGLSGAMNRRDSPNPSKSEIPHEVLLAHVEVRDFSLIIVEQKSGHGLEVVGKGIECGMAWPAKMPHYEKSVELCLPFLGVREFSSRSGPTGEWLVQPDRSIPAQNPFSSIRPLQQSLHPKYTPTSYEAQPMFYVKGINRFPPKKPLFDKEMQAILNPVLVTIKPDSITRLLDFAVASAPYLNELQEAQAVKPEGSLEGVLVQGAKSMLEDLITLKVDIQHITVSFPPGEGESYSHIRLNVKEACLLSHPQLPESQLLSTGICALTEMPGDASDFVHRRAQLRDSTLHVVKFRVIAKTEFTVQSSPTSPPESVIDVPQLNAEAAIALGDVTDLSAAAAADQLAMGDASKKAMDVRLVEGSLHIASVLGRLTQDQYKTLLRRTAQLLPLLPVAQKLNSSIKSVEKPDTPFVFVVRLDKGECCLCLEGDSAAGGAGAILPLAGLRFGDLQLCMENTAERSLVKLSLGRVNVDALPSPAHSSKLFNPNAFLQSTPGVAPVVVRLKRSVHPPAEVLIEEEAQSEHLALRAVSVLRKLASNRAYWDGDRSRVDVLVTGLCSAFNPNPACKILTFFLKSELNVKRMLATLQEAKESLRQGLEEVDIEQTLSGGLAKISDELVIDIDVNVDVRDSKVYFVRDLEDEKHSRVAAGNIEFGLGQFLIDRHAEGKYAHSSRFALSNVSLVCNKEEEDGAINTQAVYTPISVFLASNKHWDAQAKDWVLSTTGGVDKVDIGINASHSDVFMNVLHGIKMKNIQEVVDSVSEYFGQIKDLDLSDGKKSSVQISEEDVEKFNPLKAKVAELGAALDRTKEHIDTAVQEAATERQRVQSANPLVSAKLKGFLQNLEGKTWAKRFCVLGEGIFYVFDTEACGKLLGKLSCNAATTLQMVKSVKNCFQLANERKMVLAAPDEMTMTKWVNPILRMQCPDLKGEGTLGRVQEDISGLRGAVEGLEELLAEAADRAALLARIKQLEAQLAAK